MTSFDAPVVHAIFVSFNPWNIIMIIFIHRFITYMSNSVCTWHLFLSYVKQNKIKIVDRSPLSDSSHTAF